MFRKLLKYDNRAVFKYWWIAAVSTFFFAMLGGLCIQIINVEYTEHDALQVLSGLGLVLCIVALVVFLVLSEILVYVRYYKHFFTDEGYLTFTLPVKKTSLIDSKIVMALIFSISSIAILVFDVFIMLAAGIPEHLFNPSLWSDIFAVLSDFFGTLGFYSVVYIILGICILLTAFTAQLMFIFVCITIGACVTQKHKVLCAIGIYYLANAVVSFVVQLLSLGGVFTAFELIDALKEGQTFFCVALLLLGVLGIFVAVAAGLYLLLNFLLDKKLNLE